MNRYKIPSHYSKLTYWLSSRNNLKKCISKSVYINRHYIEVPILSIHFTYFWTSEEHVYGLWEHKYIQLNKNYMFYIVVENYPHNIQACAIVPYRSFLKSGPLLPRTIIKIWPMVSTNIPRSLKWQGNLLRHSLIQSTEKNWCMHKWNM